MLPTYSVIPINSPANELMYNLMCDADTTHAVIRTYNGIPKTWSYHVGEDVATAAAFSYSESDATISYQMSVR